MVDEVFVYFISLQGPRWKLLHHVHHTWHCCDANPNCDADVVVYDTELGEYLCRAHASRIILEMKKLDATLTFLSRVDRGQL